MKTIKLLTVCLMVALPLLMVKTRAEAQSDLLFTLDSAIQSGSPGSEVVFTGTLANTGVAPLFLNGIAFNFDGVGPAYLSGDANLFLNSVPISLAASGTVGDTYVGPIFGVNLDPTTPYGTYTGSVMLTGGADGNATNLLGTQNFGMLAQPPSGSVPETDTWFMAILGLMVAGLCVRSRRWNVAEAL